MENTQQHSDREMQDSDHLGTLKLIGTANESSCSNEILKLESRPDAVSLTRSPKLIMLTETPKGRGIFATAPIPSRTIVDVSPVLVMDPEENEQHISKSKVWFYTYNWPLPRTQQIKFKSTQALPLGLGSMFNHSSSASRRHNTGFTRNVEQQTITYITLRDVEAGEELCICYGESGRLGFVDAKDGEEREDRGVQDELDNIGDITKIDAVFE